MFNHPNFNPNALEIGPFSIKWYGLMYLIGFALAYWLARRRTRANPNSAFTTTAVDDMLFYAVIGVILGGRLGYIIFYKPLYYLQNPLEILQVWAGGMSFHGGFLGVLIGVWLALRKHDLSQPGDPNKFTPWLRAMDFIAPLVPPGLAAGRVGNFINGELYGRVTDGPWGMLFHSYGAGSLPRHPSQLYQFALEGVALFVILWIYSSRPRPTAAVSAVFLIGYGVFRFAAEFFREPDDFLGLLAFKMSMGQWLSVPMILGGLALLRWAYRPAAAPLRA